LDRGRIAAEGKTKDILFDARLLERYNLFVPFGVKAEGLKAERFNIAALQ